MELTPRLDAQVELAVEQIRRSLGVANFAATVRGGVVTVTGDAPDRRAAVIAMSVFEATVVHDRIVSRLTVRGSEP